MILALWIFSSILQNRVDSFVVDFIVDATPVLYPPARISIHLCGSRYDTIRLSRELSRSRLVHKIHNDLEGFETMSHDPLEHRNLYILDLDCDYAGEVLRMANSTGMFIAPTKWLLLQDRRFPAMENDTFANSTNGGEIVELFEDIDAYPDSDVVLATRLDDNFLEIMSIYRPSPYRGVILEDRGNWTSGMGVRMTTHDVASRRRRNLHLTPLKSCLVMTEPDTINHLTDYEDKHIDAVTKANYPWILHIVNRMNATVSFNIANTWGYRSENGSWSGMIGMLQRREIDIGGTGTFFISQRIGVVQYIQLYTKTGSRFVFRQPLLSSLSNIFTLPFQRSVWAAIGILMILGIVLLYVSTYWEYRRGTSPSSAKYWSQMNPAKQTLSDNFMVVLGAVAQQGFSYEPYRVPSRIVTLMILIAALSLYASYTANIVALLQSTSDAIKTQADLLNSPLKLGAQDVVYNRYYFKSFQDPMRRAIIDQRIEPKGQKSNWMSIEEGVRRIRDELFAFHGEQGIIYKMMQDTYQEEEKCGITEIDFLNVLYPLLVIQMRSPYLEIVKNGALLLRESGLKFREEYRLYTEKPQCQGQTGFISIGFTECYFAIVSMGYGAILSLVVLAIEFLWRWREKSINRDEGQDAEEPDNGKQDDQFVEFFD